jgi:hypothetical protein
MQIAACEGVEWGWHGNGKWDVVSDLKIEKEGKIPRWVGKWGVGWVGG